MAWLLLDKEKISIDEIGTLPLEKRKADFGYSALKFCQEWLAGKNEFTISTSGSTGTPKTITHSRSQMEASARQTIQALNLKNEETALVCLDTQYIAGQMMLVRSLLSGMNMVIVAPSSNPLSKIENQKIDFAALVPLQLEFILKEAPEKLNEVRCAIIGGALVSSSLKEKVKHSRCEVFATYGMTETLSHIALQRLNGDSPQDYFEAFPLIEIRLDQRDCLCIKSHYHPTEIVTNDLVELIGQNKFRWLGRIDNVINTGGIKVIPEKVETILQDILNSFSIKNRFFIAGLPDPKLGSRVIALFENPSFNKEIQEEVLFEAHSRLTKYEVPKEIFFVNQFTETQNGKINRLETIKFNL